MSLKQGHIVIVGSGVIGLTLCYLLLKSKKFQVTIAAEWIPPSDNIQFTSAHAGAIWRSFADGMDQAHEDYDRITFQHLLKLTEEYPELKSIIQLIPVVEGWENSSEYYLPWFKDFVPNFELLEGKQLPSGIDKGFQYDTICINTPEYLMWLKDQFIKLGGRFVQAKLNKLEDCLSLIHDQVDLVVNCSGLGYKTLSTNDGDDLELLPVRGQTILVHAPQLTKNLAIYPDGKEGKEEFYVILRGNGNAILGGVMQHGNWSTDYDKQTEKNILEGCIHYHPELTNDNYKVLKRNVGFRPYRQSGIRIESHYLVDKNQHKLPLIHFYGHGGAGYQSSWGSSIKVFNLINSTLQLNHKL